ncbi:MAG: T9SS type A sorting domain-containing protein, partial [Elusimicrobia bacterium]|nr:T9SS type A sorting domain-containing protein [Elusimicrobiota bacterium]
TATDAASLKSLTATLYPAYDMDYYSVPLGAGKFKVTANLPSASNVGTYHVLMLQLYNANRKLVASIYPDISVPGWYGTCPDDGECYTTASSVSLEYNVPSAGRHILSVSAGPNQYYFSSSDNSLNPYSLLFEFNPSGSASAEIVSAKFDNDTIRFRVPFTKFLYSGAPPWDDSLDSTVEKYDHARLRDHNMSPLTQATTAGGYLEDVSMVYDETAKIMTGSVRLMPGFEKRYPAVGSVHVEVFGKTRNGKVVSMGVSGPIKLTASKTDVKPWNNIFNPMKGGKTTVRYDLMTSDNVKIEVYTMDQKLVKTLYDGPAPVGKGAVDWDGKNTSGSVVASGVYVLRVRGNGIDFTHKIVVIK